MTLESIWPILDLIPPNQSTIVVAGAWKGFYMTSLAKRFPQARIIGFEPQTEAYEEISKWALPSNCELRNYGLGLCDQDAMMGAANSDGCSVLSNKAPFCVAKIKDAVPVLSELGLITLFVMNMEGYEYLLLPYLIGSKVLRRVQSLAVQFHPEFCSANLCSALEQHYGTPLYMQYPTWSYWKCQ